MFSIHVLAGALTSAIVLVGSCVPTAEHDLDPLGSGPIEGFIVQLDRPTSSSGDRPTIHVKEPGEECGVIFTIDSQTRIELAAADGRVTPADPSVLVLGRRVRAWAPVILESCPAQASATQVHVLEEEAT
jgi:hypothetical protein